MRNSLLLILLFLFTVSGSAKTNNELKVDGLTQLQAQIAQAKGKIVYVDFWASWCGPCRQSFPWLNKMQQEHSGNGFTVISVNLDAKRQFADEFLAQVPANFDVIYDPKGLSARHYKIKGMPSSFIVDRKGNIVSQHVGFNAEKQQIYQQELVNLIADKSL